MIERVRRSRWPLVIVLFGLCVLIKLNGSSVAFWTKILHEPETQSGLLLFSPKLVRLDEWRAWTPSVLSEARQNSPFPIENPSLGAGRSPLLMSVPVAPISALLVSPSGVALIFVLVFNLAAAR
jgi:hypothetical protein